MLHNLKIQLHKTYTKEKWYNYPLLTIMSCGGTTIWYVTAQIKNVDIKLLTECIVNGTGCFYL